MFLYKRVFSRFAVVSTQCKVVEEVCQNSEFSGVLLFGKREVLTHEKVIDRDNSTNVRRKA